MRALDLFAGMGGASLGLERAGFRTTGVEFDKRAALLHDMVCGEGSVVQADIAALQPEQFGTPDLLWMSPPCQPFSHAGLKRGLEDPRGHLIFEVPRWVEALRPRWVICEQVQAVLPWWEAFAERFREIGYHTWTGKLSAERFGIPQTRVRAFLLASLDGPVGPPEPTHRRFFKRAPHLRAVDEHLHKWVSMAEALEWVEADDLVGFPRRDDLGTSPTGYRERDFRPGGWPAFTLTSKAQYWTVNTRCDSRPGVGAVQRRSVMYPATSFTTKSGNQWLFENERTPGEVMRMTVPAALALQTFDPRCLDGAPVPKTAAFLAIGNAVPPLWAQTIAHHLVNGDSDAHRVG